jgi:hypothetical protein
VVGPVGDDVHRPAGEGEGEPGDQGRGDLDRPGAERGVRPPAPAAVPAGQPEPGQHRQGDLAEQNGRRTMSAAVTKQQP